MKHLFAFLFLLGITFSLSAQSVRERILLDDGWQFAFGNASSPEKDFGCGTEYFNYLTKAASIHNEGPYSPKFNPEKWGVDWKTVNLPHDWVVDLPYAKEAKKNIVAKLTPKDDKYACSFADKIISESQETDEWYKYFDDFASLLSHPKSFVRNQALYILASNAQWDEKNRFDFIFSDFLAHVTDEKSITARQCIKSLAQGGAATPQYISRILSCL